MPADCYVPRLEPPAGKDTHPSSIKRGIPHYQQIVMTLVLPLVAGRTLVAVLMC
jgi:hypothetical protein